MVEGGATPKESASNFGGKYDPKGNPKREDIHETAWGLTGFNSRNLGGGVVFPLEMSVMREL